MSNSEKMNKVINEAFDELMAMPQEELLEKLDEQTDGDIAALLEYSGAIMFTHENLIDWDSEKGEPTGKPIVSELKTVEHIRSFIEAGKAGEKAGKRLKERFGEEDINS